MAKHHRQRKHGEPHVQPSERVPGKFDAVAADGTVNPYAFRTEADAWRSMGVEPPTDVEEVEVADGNARE